MSFDIEPDDRYERIEKPCLAVKLSDDCMSLHHLCMQKAGHQGPHICCSCGEEYADAGKGEGKP